MKKKIILALVALLLLPTIALAHGLNLELVEPGVLKAEYEGGGFSPRMEFTLYDKDDKILVQGPIDENGEFHFDPNLDFQKAVVDDGMGHVATYEKGQEPTKEIPKLPVVIIVFGVIGLIFYFNKRKKK